MAHQPPLASPTRARRDAPWVWVAVWLLVMLAGAFWVLRPAPAYVAPPGWAHMPETGPVLDVIAEGQDLIVAGRNGLFRVRDGDVGRVDVSGMAAAPVSYALARDASGRLWIGHETGVTVMAETAPRHLDRIDGTLLKEVRALEFDPQGRAWIGFNGGVGMIENAADFGAGGEARATLLRDDVRVLSALVDDQGGVWAGTTDGLWRFAPQNATWQAWNTGDGLPNRQVASMMQDRDGRVWIGTGFHQQGGTLVFEPDGAAWRIAFELPAERMAAPKTRSLFQDGHGNIWLGTETNGFSVLAADRQAATIVPGDKLPDVEVTSIGAMPGGGVWLGTLDGLVTLAPEAVSNGLRPER